MMVQEQFLFCTMQRVVGHGETSMMGREACAYGFWKLLPWAVCKEIRCM